MFMEGEALMKDTATGGAGEEALRRENGEALVRLASLGDMSLKQVRVVLDQPVDLEARNRRGFTPLLTAAFWNALEIARALIGHGANLEAVEDTGGTPLYWACFRGHTALASLLLDKGARLKVTVWEAAQNSDNLGITDLLMAEAVKQSGSPAPRIPCDCEMLTETTRPSDLQSRGTFTIVMKDVHEGWSETYGLCRTCRRRWKVTDDPGYHYTTFAWEELKAGEHEAAFAGAEGGAGPFRPFSEYQSKRERMGLLLRRDPRLARLAAETVLFFDPDDALAWLILGAACDATGDEAKAREILESAPKRQFAAAQATEVREFVQSLLKQSKHRLLPYASEFSQALVGENPDDLFAAGVARGARGDPESARAILERVVELKPDHFDAWFSLGVSYLETAEPLKAIPCFERSLSIAPENHQVSYHLALARERAGDKSGALRAYEDAQKSRPFWGGQSDRSSQVEEAIERLRTPKEVFLKGGHKREVECVAFSADGKILASGSRDQTIRLWEASTGKPLARLGGHANSVDCLAFSPDGRYLASRECLTNTFFLWDLASETRIRTWSGGSQSVWRIAFSPDGGLLALEADKTEVALVDTGTRAEVRRMKGHTDGIIGMAFHPKGEWLASGSRDLTARIWEVASGREIQRFTDHQSVLGSVAFSPDRRWFATGGYDGLLTIREVDGWKHVRSLVLEGTPVNSVTFGRDGRVYFIARRTVHTCELHGGEAKILIPGIEVVSSYALSPDHQLLATGYSDYQDQRLHVWDPVSQKAVWKI